MIRKGIKHFCLKVTGVLCVLALLIGTVFVPLSFGASAAVIEIQDNETVTFSFEESENPVTTNDDSLNMTRGGDGVGCASWAMKVFESNGMRGIGWKHTNNVGWATAGGYRLNNNDGVYMLEPSSTYIVSFKLSVVSAPVFSSSSTAVDYGELKLGYGFAAGTGGNSGNTVNSMNTVISKVFSIDKVNADNRYNSAYTVYNGENTRNYTVSNEKHELTYVFTTPEDLGKGSPTLGFFARTIYGMEFVVDDVKVTRLSDDMGVIVLVDEYYGTTTAISGKKDDKAEFPELTSEEEAHEFKGWFKDELRTEPAVDMAFGKEVQTVYSAWKAPVTVTFVDTLNGGEPYSVSGLAGEEIVFPEDPVDTVNNPEAQWFMGWYTTEGYTEEYTAKTFGYTSYNVYSKWQGVIEDQVEDFETYTKDSYSVTTNDKGEKTKSNGLYFGSSNYKIDDTTENGNGKVIALKWDAEMVRDKDNHETYNAAERYSSPQDRALIIEDVKLIEGTVYTVTFDYYVENISDTQLVTVIPMTNSVGNIWEAGVNLYNTQGAHQMISASNKDGEWHKGEFTFTAKFAVPTRNAFYFILGMIENSDTVIYFDNVKAVAVQPYETTITYKENNGKSDKIVIGKRGDKIEEYIPENNGLKFLGWFTDETLSIPFTAETLGKENVTVYAKWGGKVQNFKTYNKPGAFSFTAYSLDIDKKEGAGIDDNFALVWNFDGDKVIDENGTLMYTKIGNTSHLASVVYDLSDNTTYEISFYVKVDSANSDATLKMLTAHGFNIYEAPSVEYASAQCVISKDDVGKGWVKKSVVLTTKFSKSQYENIPDDLYFVFAPNINEKETEIQLHIDNIAIVEVTQDLIIFNGNAAGVQGGYQLGNAGDKINFPVLSNGDAQFLGWYSDATCDTPFTATEMVEGITEIYARWTALPITFDNYQYYSTSALSFGSRLKLSKENGNNLLNFTLDGDEQKGTDKNGNPTYWRERITTSYDHIARLDELHDKTAYKITYYYKSAKDSNTDVKITFATANATNIWETTARTVYNSSEQKVSASANEWTKTETIIFTDFKNETGKWLYIMFAGDCKTTDTGRYISVDVDNILIEKIDKPYIIYDGQNDSYKSFVEGTLGGEIRMPATNPDKFGYNFVGWYTDKKCTEPFTKTVFDKAEAIVVYAGYKKSSEVLFDFENFNIQNNSGWYQFGRGTEVVKNEKAASGVGAIKVLRTTEATNNYQGAYIVLGDNTTQYDLDISRKYVVTFKYYIEKSGTKDLKISFNSAGRYNYFQNGTSISDTFVVGIMEKEGVWKTGALIIDATKCRQRNNYIYLNASSGNEGIYYIDDIHLTELPEGHIGYAVDNGGCTNVPMYVTGAVGTSFASRLPKKPYIANHIFTGYTYFDSNANEGELTTDKMVFGEESIRIKANFVRIKTVQDFEGGYEALSKVYGDYSNMDFDWEQYDALAEGNSKENVTSGRYSIHRKGTTMHFENIQVLTQDLALSVGERYKVTMKVKLGKHFQTDGAVKFVSCKSPYYPWATTGDYYPIVAINDLTDGQWHEVSYVFNAVELNVSLQTPGYCELFIDDIVFERVDENTPLSTPISFTEYVPALRDENGNLLDMPAVVIDIYSIIDESLGKEEASGGFLATVYSLLGSPAFLEQEDMLYVLIGAGVFVLAVAVLVIVLILKKKKKS